MASDTVYVGQLICDSTTPPPDRGFYKINDTTTGHVGKLVMSDPVSGKESVALTATLSDRGVTFSTPISDGQRIGAFGDSWMQNNLYCGQQVANAAPGGLTGGYTVYAADLTCPSGAGTLTYDATTKTLAWAPFGLSAGPVVDASKCGFIYIPGPQTGTGIWLMWFGNRGASYYTSGSVTITVQANGFQVWQSVARGLVSSAMARARQRVVWAPWSGHPAGVACAGIGGATISDYLAASHQWSGIVTDIDVISLGTNSIANGDAFSQMTADYTSILNLRAQNTRHIICCGIPPRDLATTAQRRLRARFNQWLARLCERTAWLTYFDLPRLVTDPSSGNFAAALSTDKIHLRDYGGMVVGAALGDLILRMLPAASDPQRYGYDDVYDATNNPSGSLMAAGVPTLAGAAGTAGTGASGAVPTGVTISRTNGSAMTATCSFVAKTDGPGNDWQIAVSGAAATETVTATYTLTPNPQGKTIVAQAEIEITASSSLAYVDVQLVAAGTGFVQASGLGPVTNDVGEPDNVGVLVLRTPPTPIGPSVASVSIKLLICCLSGGSATVKLKNWSAVEFQP